jgi:hypothetical protein
MNSLRSLSKRNTQPCVWLCLLLAVSFLYNPYLIAPGSGIGLNVRHSASHRATVGASELQQLAPMSSWEAHPIGDAILVAQFSASPDTNSRYFVATRDTAISRKFFCSSLWFRPPPAA